MIRPRLAVRAAGSLAVLAVSAVGLSGQERVVSAAQSSQAHAALVGHVAMAWNVDASLVHVQVSGGIPEAVDSVTATASSPTRWIATFHVGDRTIRRFVDVGHTALVEVAATRLRRGTVIDSLTIDRALRIVPGPPTEVEASALGMVTERAIEAGDLLTHPAVRPPYLIRGGDQVEAVLERGAFTMTILGEALGSAREGEIIQVRLASGVRRRARATRQGVVTLIPGGE